MKLEEVLPALRDGKKIRRPLWDDAFVISGAMVKEHVGSALFPLKNLTQHDVLAEDWEVIE